MSFVIKTIIGNLKITCENLYIIKVEITDDIPSEKLDSKQNEIKDKFINYFNGDNILVNMPIKITTTSFKDKVYRELLKVPYGQTVTYKDLAIRINNPNASRAVGNAMRTNPIPFIIPCHRVVGKNNPGAYLYGEELKKFLINLEKNNSRKFGLWFF